MEAIAYDWQTLTTVAGASAATLLIVQYTKAPLDRVWKIPTRAFVWLVAFVLLLLAQWMGTGLAPGDVPLLCINAFVVAFAAMGAYESTYGKGEKPHTTE